MNLGPSRRLLLGKEKSVDEKAVMFPGRSQCECPRGVKSFSGRGVGFRSVNTEMVQVRIRRFPTHSSASFQITLGDENSFQELLDTKI